MAILRGSGGASSGRLPKISCGASSDVVVVQSTTEALEMERATATVPMVMVLIGDPVGAGLVPQPGPTGREHHGYVTDDKRGVCQGLEFLKELLPTARRVAAAPETLPNASVVRNWIETCDAARRLDIELLSSEVRSRV